MKPGKALMSIEFGKFSRSSADNKELLNLSDRCQ